jgi:hypothetical protein
LMLVARALRVVEHVLGCRPPGLCQPALGLADALLGVAVGIVSASVNLAVELRLFLIKASLIAVSDRLLAIPECLLEASDALVGVKVLLRSVWHVGHVSCRLRGRSCVAGAGRANR